MSTGTTSREPTAMDILVRMMGLPFTTFAYGMELMIRMMRGAQAMSQTGLDTMAGGASAPESRQDYGWSNPGDARQEETGMTDRDLSGDDLKVVRYRIIFSKRDLEVAFAMEEDLVAYSTNGDAWAGLKVAEFVADVMAGNVQRPKKWRDNDYPSKDSPDQGWELPEEDKRYIQIYYEVLQRIPRERSDHERDQVRVLRQIRDKIG